MRWLGAGLIAAVLATGPARANDLTPAQAAEAVKRHVCFSTVWWADPYVRLGQTATVDVRTDGRVAYLWSEDMRAVPRVKRWADSYVVAVRPAGPVVTQRSGYNVDLLRGEAAFERERRRIYVPGGQRLTVNLPASCDPKFEADTPAKAEMRAAVLASLTNAVRTWGRRPTGGQVRMTVANFDVDYPETFALRQDTGEVLRIALLSSDPSGTGKARQYTVTPAVKGPVAAKLRRLILRYGQSRVISLR
ncbi:MAG: hypothetical protein AB1942_01790 [Pseudomonadota bacterium]